MDRKAKIAKLKALQEGRVKLFDGMHIVWDKVGECYHCENNGFEHLKLTEEKFNDFCDKYGGHHIVFYDSTGSEDAPIHEQNSVSKIVWHESRDDDEEDEVRYAPESKIETNTDTFTPTPIETPAKQSSPVIKLNREKEKAELRKCLDQIESDMQTREKMNTYKQINREFL